MVRVPTFHADFNTHDKANLSCVMVLAWKPLCAVHNVSILRM